jgi:hypothetical protein
MPWRVERHQRTTLLEWFLTADLEAEEHRAIVLALTGWTADPPRRELGTHKLGKGQYRPSKKEIRDHCAYYRTALLKARAERAHELKSVTARRSGLSFFTLSRLLEDVHPDVVRDHAQFVELPEDRDHLSTSLVGELALEAWHQAFGAKSSVVCRFCGRIALFNDPRQRVICGDDECRRAYLRQYKKTTTQRAKRSRAQRAKGGTRNGKTSKR